MYSLNIKQDITTSEHKFFCFANCIFVFPLFWYYLKQIKNKIVGINLGAVVLRFEQVDLIME